MVKARTDPLATASVAAPLNQEPIGEQGGLNLYAFVRNNAVNRLDYLGMDLVVLNYRDTIELPKIVVTAYRQSAREKEWIIDMLNRNAKSGPAAGGGGGASPAASNSTEKPAEDTLVLDKIVVTDRVTPPPNPTPPSLPGPHVDPVDAASTSSAPNKPPEKRCAELAQKYGQYLNAQSGAFFDDRTDAQKAMLVNAALGQREGWEYSAHVIDMNALAARNGTSNGSGQYFVTPAFSNWMAGQPRTNANGTAYVSAQHDPWFMAGIGLAGTTRRSDGNPTIGYPNSAIRDSVHTHPPGGGEGFSGSDQWFYGDHATGNGMTGYVITPSSNVLSTAGYGAPVKNVNAIPQKDLQDIRGCFGNGRL